MTKNPREACERYRLLFESIRDAVLITTPDGTILDINQSGLEQFGYTKDEFAEMRMPDLYADPADRQKLLDELVHDTFVKDYEVKMKKKDGTLMDCLLTFNTFEGGEVVFFQGIVRDITRRKNMERAVREQLHFLQSLLDSIPVPVFLKDASGIYTGCNRAFEKYMGKDRQEIIGRTVYDVAPRELADVYREADESLFSTGGVQVYETHVPGPEGSIRQVEFNKAVFLNADGSMGGIIGTIFDVTERNRMTAEREQLIRELQEALSNIKTLKGRLPICAWCKKIRDEEGYWQKVEEYIEKHSGASFTHGICQECLDKIDKDFYD